MSVEDLEKYEAEMELQLYKEYRDVLPMFKFVVETERRFYLANDVKVETQHAAPRCGSRSSSATHGSGTCTARHASCRT